MKIRHATLNDVIGRTARSRGYTFVAADLKLAGHVFRFEFRLRDLPRDRIPPVLRAPIDHGYDASWIVARIPHVFGFAPEPSQTEKTLLSLDMVALPEGAEEAIAFRCTDYYGKSGLVFSPDENDAQAKQGIAEAFWELLLREPDALSDFQTRVVHLGASVTLVFGCENGEPYLREIPDIEE